MRGSGDGKESSTRSRIIAPCQTCVVAVGMLPYAEVAVGLPVHGTYHYAVPEGLGAAACVGARVLVPFGARGVTGVIVRRSERLPDDVIDVDKIRALGSIL